MIYKILKIWIELILQNLDALHDHLATSNKSIPFNSWALKF